MSKFAFLIFPVFFCSVLVITINMKATGNLILEKSFAFSLGIIEFTDLLEASRKFAIAGQLLRSGTSIGANIREAQAPESKADFIHKMKIAAKEAEETAYWLLLCTHSKSLPDPGDLHQKCTELQKILSAILSTSKKRS